jgi:hypothetical protein
MNKKRGQVSAEYMIIVSFVTFLVLTTLGTAFFYTSEIKDSIKFNHLENFANKIITSSESIFFAGIPSRIEITGYIPEGVTDITISGQEIIFEVETASGRNVISYHSKVTLEVAGSPITPSAGVKQLLLIAKDDRVTISNAI